MMHGLVNYSFQCFLQDTYGPHLWKDVTRQAELGFDRFETMIVYETSVTDRIISASSRLLNRPRDTILEDLGTYLVSHPNLQSLRRLLRFGGSSYSDFLHSLDDLPGRARLASPDLDIPNLKLVEHTPTDFTLFCQSPITGAGFVIVGLLRAMADDYGALSLVEHRGSHDHNEIISITLAENAFGEDRGFNLSQTMTRI